MASKRQRTSRKKSTTHKSTSPDDLDFKDLTIDEAKCIVCTEILTEPVTLPCRCQTRMRCTLCRMCIVAMTSAEDSTCREECPQCRVRMASLYRRNSKDDYRRLVNHKLEAALVEQRDYLLGTMNKSLSPVRHEMATRGEVGDYYVSERRVARQNFQQDRQEEEEESLAALQGLLSPAELKAQKDLEKKLELEKESLRLAEQLQKEETSGLRGSSKPKTQKEIESELASVELAKRLQGMEPRRDHQEEEDWVPFSGRKRPRDLSESSDEVLSELDQSVDLFAHTMSVDRTSCSSGTSDDTASLEELFLP